MKERAIKALAALLKMEPGDDGTVWRKFNLGTLDCWVGFADLFDDDGWIELSLEIRAAGWPRAIHLAVPINVGDLGGLD